MLNFTQNVSLTLSAMYKIDYSREAAKLLLSQESVFIACKEADTSVIFTDRRIIVIEVQDSGKSYSILPYRQIRYYSLDVKELKESVSDARLYLLFENGFEFYGRFKDNINAIQLQNILADHVMS